MTASSPNSAELGKKLVAGGAISADQLKLALEEMERDGSRLPEQLVALNLVDEVRLLEAMAEIYDMPVIDEASLHADAEMLDLAPSFVTEETALLPLRRVGNALNVAVSDPSDDTAVQRLAAATDLKVRLMLAGPTALRTARNRLQMLSTLAAMPGEEGLAPYIPLFTTLKDLRFIKTIARGGFARVFQFHQLSLNRVVALKVLDSEWSSIDEIARRFDQEGEIIARLDHPNIVRVYEQGASHDFRYIVMEFFEGDTIDKALRGKDLVSKLACLRSVAAALGYAHSQGIVHRDIKPGNILMNARGQIKLLDFGVARLEAAPGAGGFTRPQLVLGTPRFMAPEVQNGATNASPRSDIFAFGVMAHDLLIEKRCEPDQADHPSLIDPRIPLFFGQTILDCMARDPQSRPASFEELGQIVQQALDRVIFGDGSGGQVAESDSPAPAERPASRSVSPLYEEVMRERERTNANAGKLQSIESRYEFKSVLRRDNRCKTAVAFHRRLERPVVIRVIKKRLTSSKTAVLREAISDHIAPVYGVGRRDGSSIVVREYIDGQPLSARLGHPMEAIEALTVIDAVVKALREAKKLNLGHGNLHPGNVLLGNDGSIKVTDFGLATQASEEFPRYRGGEGSIMGDRFALGVLAFELIMGRDFQPEKSLEDHMQELVANRRAHPLLKYFLGRLWRNKRYQPPYNDYEDMLADLERIRSRMLQQEEWIQRREKQAAESATADSPRDDSIANKTTIGRTLGRLTRFIKT